MQSLAAPPRAGTTSLRIQQHSLHSSEHLLNGNGPRVAVPGTPPRRRATSEPGVADRLGSTQHVVRGVLMEPYSPRLLALSLTLGWAGVTGWSAVGVGLGVARAQPARSLPLVEPVRAPEEPAPEPAGGAVAWDCVPTYWWGYWTWAWQPCAWIDRSYVENAIGAIAAADTTEDDQYAPASTWVESSATSKQSMTDRQVD
jgi:hypothetical protein